MRDSSAPDAANRSAESPAWRWLRLWRAGQAGDVRQFLAEHTLTPVEIVAVLLVEQRERWQQGERIPAEMLYSWYPEVRANAEAAVELIYGEFLLRKQLGEAPDVADYRHRFPEHADALARQFALHSALQSADRHSAMTVDYVGDGAAAGEGGSSHVGRYVVQSVLGKGGMGLAYRAWDPSLKRIVVVKTLQAARGADDDERARFRAEAQAIAGIRHPHIVQVFDVGDHEGEPYFAMEYCEGGSLAGKLRDPLPPREAARLVEQIAQGIAAAHAANVVHRDLKPGNVLLASGTAADADAPPTFVPKVADFGLAKKLDADDDQTRTGAVMGTPAYMAPEQAFGASKHVGPAADIYSLGVLLYECLTGRPPFKGATLADTLDQVRHREPVPVRQLQPKTPADLETITLKCLEKDPSRRYATAAALADDLNRFLDGRPTHARPLGPARRAGRWCRRNPVVTALLALALGGLLGTTGMWLQAQANYRESEANFDMAVDAVNKSFRRVSQDRLLFLPSMKPLRGQLMSDARTFYDKLAEKRRHDPRLKFQLALADCARAEIETAIGSPDRALQLWQEARARLSAMHQASPDNGFYRAELAACLQRHSQVLREFGRRGEARGELVAAAEHFAALSRQLPAEPHFVLKEAESLQELADLLADLGDRTQPLPLVRRGLERAKAYAALTDNGPFVRYQVGHAHTYAGHLLYAFGKHREAVKELEAARQILSPLADRPFREQAVARYELSRALGILGSAYGNLGQLDDAEKAMLPAQELLEQMARDAPTVTQYRRNRAVNAHNLAVLYTSRSRLTEAVGWCRKAMQERELLHQEFPKQAAFANDLTGSYRQMAILALKNNKPGEHLQWDAKAGAIGKPTAGQPGIK